MPTALFSLTDKTGAPALAAELAQRGWTLLASGGTAALLREHGLPVREVADLTGSPEILGGRVKTLHPAVHGGILSRRTPEDQQQLESQGWGPIDLVAVNLYAFQNAVAAGADLAGAVEQIDIGGVALLRAAAKNFAHVLTLCDPADYPRALEALADTDLRQQLAAKAFAHTAAYDSAIAAHLGGPRTLTLHRVQDLRYGENPHQSATLYSLLPDQGPLGGRLLQGKELSYNNLLDLDAAWRAAGSFPGDDPVAVVVKHLSPCGVARGPEALRLAIEADRTSAFGGIIAVNVPFEAAMVDALGDLFLECIAAPLFTPEARQRLSAKKNLRLLEAPGPAAPHEFRSLSQGVLWQDRDPGQLHPDEWKVVTRRVPTAAEQAALEFNWRVVQSVRSNAIVVGGEHATFGIGGGQTNRVDAVRQALERAGDQARGAVLASDAFFPFADSIQTAAAAGIAAVVQPGGSVRDADSVAAADELGLALVFTGRRHFRH